MRTHAPERFEDMSERERQCMDALIRVGRCKLIARELNISHRTVESHIENVLYGMNIPNTIVLAVEYERWRSAQAKNRSGDEAGTEENNKGVIR